MAFFNTKNAGPIVLEVPAAGEDGTLNANICDIWQMPLEDAGPSGADAGKGGKYLLLPPGYADPIPNGYIVLRPATFESYVLLRSNLESHGDADVAKSVAYGKKVKVYPLSQAAIRRRPCSPMRRASCSIPPFVTTQASSLRSTESCRASRGCRATV
jgi:hypothetical protein